MIAILILNLVNWIQNTLYNKHDSNLVKHKYLKFNLIYQYEINTFKIIQQIELSALNICKR